MTYVDGFLLPIPVKKVAEYRTLARKAGKVWLEHGALEFRECMADDLDSPMGAIFRNAVNLKRGEVVFFSYITYKSRAQRDRVNKKVMADPRLESMMKDGVMPFDTSRMAFGGFKPVVDL
mgnify:FL=1|jgi:uncharacterized protein YbaA (DUF1428 family)